MPKLPQSKPRPWIPKKKPKQIRQVDNSKFYNSKQWRATRNFYIQANPLCEECDRNGIITGAQCVDHITPITKGGHETHQGNLQSLCNPCHAKKSSREGIEYRKGIKTYGNVK
jgi:5-methylcytosine-specific restriction protein A